MAMTKKDFEALAEILRTQREIHSKHTQRLRILEALDDVEHYLITYLKTQNPQFDEKRFRERAQNARKGAANKGV